MANQRLNAKIEIGASVDRTVGRALSGIQSSLKKVGHEIRDVDKAQKDLGRQREVLVRQGRSVEALDREYADLGRTLDHRTYGFDTRTVAAHSRQPPCPRPAVVTIHNDSNMGRQRFLGSRKRRAARLLLGKLRRRHGFSHQRSVISKPSDGPRTAKPPVAK